METNILKRKIIRYYCNFCGKWHRWMYKENTIESLIDKKCVTLDCPSINSNCNIKMSFTLNEQNEIYLGYLLSSNDYIELAFEKNIKSMYFKTKERIMTDTGHIVRPLGDRISFYTSDTKRYSPWCEKCLNKCNYGKGKPHKTYGIDFALELERPKEEVKTIKNIRRKLLDREILQYLCPFCGKWHNWPEDKKTLESIDYEGVKLFCPNSDGCYLYYWKVDNGVLGARHINKNSEMEEEDPDIHVGWKTYIFLRKNVSEPVDDIIFFNSCLGYKEELPCEECESRMKCMKREEKLGKQYDIVHYIQAFKLKQREKSKQKVKLSIVPGSDNQLICISNCEENPKYEIL